LSARSIASEPREAWRNNKMGARERPAPPSKHRDPRLGRASLRASRHGAPPPPPRRQAALFALAVADVLLVNIWCHDIGREHGSGKPLMKTIFQVGPAQGCKACSGSRPLAAACMQHCRTRGSGAMGALCCCAAWAHKWQACTYLLAPQPAALTALRCRAVVCCRRRSTSSSLRLSPTAARRCCCLSSATRARRPSPRQGRRRCHASRAPMHAPPPPPPSRPRSEPVPPSLKHAPIAPSPPLPLAFFPPLVP
jgi:hypothetical protein